MSIPVIFIAIANETPHSNNYLRNLPQEAIGLRSILTEAEENKLCEFIIINDATIDAIIRVFQQKKYQDRIAAFHFAGHAGDNKLFLKDNTGARQASHGEGLVPFLASQRSLQLVFLNGCHTSAIAEGLNELGVPAVIGTSFAVQDDIATNLSLNFYRGLTRGLGLERVWNDAVHQIKAMAKAGDADDFHRAIFREDMHLAGQAIVRLPWSLTFSKGKEDTRHWNLPQAADNPLFGLASIEDRYDLLNEPFEFLKKYEEKGTRNFFGRSKYIQSLYQRLLDSNASPLVLFHGQSGVGKSSFLNAGLIPRLKVECQVSLKERSREKGLANDFIEAIEKCAKACLTAPLTGASPLDLWLEIEEQTQQPFILIIDQVEEVFTRPSVLGRKEIDGFLALISTIFANPSLRPKGKILLSYRKEFHPEISDAVSLAGLPFEQVFLKKLAGENIEEIVNGLASTTAHRLKYNVEIEEGLPEIIAADLLKDTNSPIAPVLQILLTKLWHLSKTQESPVFSVVNYNYLRKQGVFLDDFFQEQMLAFKTSEEEFSFPVVSTGLALDVLNYHTTEFGTAEGRALGQLMEQYRHQEGIIPALVQKLKSLYLLSDDGKENTTLAHDTLAPIVQNAIKLSEKTGQRALRLLETKMLDYHLYPEQTLLEEEDLLTVEQGAKGMRAWSSEEEDLLGKSRKKRQEIQTKRRRRRFVQFALMGMLALAVVFIVFSWQRSERQAHGNELISQALRMEKEDPTKSMVLIRQAMPYLTDVTTAYQAAHDIYSNNEFYDTLLHFSAPVEAVTLLPETPLFALITGTELQLRNFETLELLKTITLDEKITSLATTANGKLLATTAEDDYLRIYDANGEEKYSLLYEGGVQQVVFAPDGQKVLTSDLQGRLLLWDLTEESAVTIIDDPLIIVESFAFTIDGESIVVGTEMGELQFVGLDGELRNIVNAHNDRILSLSIDPVLNILTSTSRDATTASWTIDGHLLTRFVGHDKRVNAAQWLPSLNYLLSASDDFSVRLWGGSGQTLTNYRGHTSYVNDLVVAPDEESFISAGADSTLIVWRITTKVARSFTTMPTGEATSMAMSRDGGILIAGTKADNVISEEPLDPFDFFDQEDMELASPQDVLVWNIADGGVMHLTGHEGRINDVAISAKGTFFLSAAASKALLWDSSGELVNEFNQADEINSIAFSPDEQYVATGGSDSLAVLWELKTGKKIPLNEHGDLVSAVVFAPDGKLLYTACYDNLIRVFDMTGRLVQSFTGHNSRVSCLAISLDGQHILSGGWDNQAILWSREGEILSRYPLFAKNNTGGEAVNAVAFSHKGDYLAFGGEGGLIKVLTLAGEERQTITLFSGQTLTDLAFTPFGNQLTTVVADKIQFWQLLNL